MSSAIDEAIKEIAVKHGVSVGRDDPILILQTMHDRLLEQQKQSQQALLDNFKSEIELISSQWKDDAKEKAEKVLNASLAASKAAMSELLEIKTAESADKLKDVMLTAVNESRLIASRAYKINMITLYAVSAGITIWGINTLLSIL